MSNVSTDGFPKISLRAVRVNAEMTQDEVARFLKVSKPTLVRWENGYSTPDVLTAQKLADLYHFPLHLIFFGKRSNYFKPED